MLNIFCGRESTDKEKFIFEQIKGRTLLLVPDQFSLQAERDAFFYLKEKSLMDLRIVDFSTLGHKVIGQVGGKKPQLIDKYGRHMLLTMVMRRLEDSLRVYRGYNGKNAFIEMVNSFISEMKRYDVTPEELKAVIDRLDDGVYLKYKLQDISLIYDAYQEMIEGKYLDSEDYISFYGEKILQAPMVAESEIWIYGFDTFTPKNLQIIRRLTQASRGVNIVMTYEDDRDIFQLTKVVIGKLKELAEELGEAVAIRTIEEKDRRTVWSHGKGQASGMRAAGQASGTDAAAGTLPITLVAASGLYAEAERAAAYILKLVREKGMRFGDIVVVCNDMDLRGSILRRIFIRWGIPVFMDRKRKVLHHAAVRFLLALMESISGGYRTDAVMRLVKSGLMGFEEEDAELLENYVKEFRIKGAMWKSDFTRGGDRYDAETLNRINSLRTVAAETIKSAGEYKGTRNTVREKIEGLYRFLDKVFRMEEKLDAQMAAQEEAGLAEAAAETAQSWNVICGIFDQIVETLGDRRLSDEELLKLMQAGLEEVEIGLVPATTDCVIIGTMQRTRLSRVRVLMAVGANDGVMPLNRRDEGLLSDREKETLEGLDLEVSKRDDVVAQEEKLAIYRTLYLPEDELYVSCSGTDESGEALRPSEIFLALKRYIEKAGGAVLRDLEQSGDIMELLACREGALSHLASAFRMRADGAEMDETWMQVVNWYEEKDVQAFHQMKKGMLFDNRLETMGERLADALYRGDETALRVSASRLEKYSACPFAHFISYGLRAEEPLMYEMGAREIGDVYHQCLMRLSRKLTPHPGSGITVDHPASSWMTITEEQTREQVKTILREELGFFREGLLKAGEEEAYRTERIAEICSRAAWSMIGQVRKGRVKQMFFEYPFGPGKPLPPVTVEAGSKRVLIQGTIDRVDVLRQDGRGESDGSVGGAETSAGSGAEAVRIVDYKTGAESVDPEHFRSGYKLQLMVYLDAALRGMHTESGGDSAAVGTLEEGCFPAGGPEPAGVFHFRIAELDTDADAKPQAAEGDTLAARLEEAYRLEGIVLNDEQLVEAMDRELDGVSGVLPVRIAKKDGALTPAAGGHLLTKEEFRELTEQVHHQVQRICEELCSGSIRIRPKREKKKDMEGNFKTACKYCQYRSICMFDTSFTGCRYEKV